MEEVAANSERFPVWKSCTTDVPQFAEYAHQSCRQSILARSNRVALRVFGSLMRVHAFSVADGRIEPSQREAARLVMCAGTTDRAVRQHMLYSTEGRWLGLSIIDGKAVRGARHGEGCKTRVPSASSHGTVTQLAQESPC